MKYSANKEIHKQVKTLINQGWSFTWGGKHGKLQAPSRGITITVPKSPSCRRAATNFAKDIRRKLLRHRRYKVLRSIN